MSLVVSLTGALLAVFIRQWAQSYLDVTQLEGQHSSQERAQIRTFYAEGINRLHLPWLARAVPTLIHVSLFLFFFGLPIFLFNINCTVFNIVTTWLGLCAAGYACVTLMPIFFQDSPYYSPLSSSVRVCLNTTLFVGHRLLGSLMSPDFSIFRWYNARNLKLHLFWWTLHGMRKAEERPALQLSSDIDYRALSWMFGTLNDDDEFEQFFDTLPGLCDSGALMDPRGAFVKPNEKMLSHALIGMMDRTLSSDVTPESVKLRRVIVCTNVINATSLLQPWWTLRRILLGEWHGFSRSIQFGLFAQGLKNTQDRITAFYAQYVVAFTIVTVKERDDLWLQLTSCQLNVSTSLLQIYLKHGDSFLLANVIFIIRRAIQIYSRSPDHHRSDILAATSRTLGSLCKFDILSTLQEQQHEFCSLWNQLVDIAQNDGHPHITPLIKVTLKSIRVLYIALHERMDASSMGSSTAADDGGPVLDDSTSYTVCTMAEHRPSISVLELQLDESYPDTTGHLPPAIPGSGPTIPALSNALLSALFPAPESPVFPSPPSELYFPPLPVDTGMLPQVLRFNGYGEYAGLLYHSPHTVMFRDELYPTALHLFEARRFLDHRPDLADRVRECELVEDVPSISAELAEFTRWDWANIALSTVSKPFFPVSCVLRVPSSHGSSGWVDGFRWTTYCTTSSASTAICAR